MFNIKPLSKFSENIAIKFYETIDSIQIYRYNEIINEAISIKQCIEKLFSNTFESNRWKIPNIAVQVPCHSPLLLPAIIGVINSKASICFLDPNIISNKIEHQLKIFKTNIILVDQHSFEKHKFWIWAKFRQKTDLLVLGKQCILLVLESHELVFKEIPAEANEVNSSKVFYSTTTSGTTSETPKVISVTYKCFMPNVLALSKIYKITQTDVIFVSASPTFDPFILDVCLALQNGASLIMTTNSLRLSPNLLVQFLFHPQNGATIMQMTPSLFTRWRKEEIKETIFSPKSSLRLLALGGEPFPTMDQVSLWQDWNANTMKRVFNLYGLTEISCWCSIYEITKEDVFLNKEIPLGEPLDDLIRFRVKSVEFDKEIASGIGELYIETKIRKCFLEGVDDAIVLNNSASFTFKTGDVVEIDENGNLLYRCRSDCIVKRYGRKVNLNDIQQLARSNTNVVDACCVFERNQNLLLLFVILDSHISKNWSIIQKELRQSFSVKNLDTPNTIVSVKEFPLSSHGKVSKRTLLADYEKSKEAESSEYSTLDCFTKAVNETLDFKHILLANNFKTVPKTRLQKRQKSLWDLSFVSLGGDSLKALNLTKELEMKCDCLLPSLLSLLLNENVSIRDVFLHVSTNSNKCVSTSGTMTKQSKPEDALSMGIKWSVDLKKCIDATPTICLLDDFQPIISVGSHAGILMNLLAENGEIISKLILPDRIESQVTQYKQYGIVGCYDGFLYCFDIRMGSIKWTFNSGGMIKSRPLCNDTVIFGNYSSSKNLWCLNAEDGVLLWSNRIGTKSIYSNPIQFDGNHIIVCTLDGTVAKVNSTTGALTWKANFNTPIFSTCSVFHVDEERYIILATVDGTINCLSGSGTKIWSHKVDCNIFSSFELVEQYDSQSTSFVNFLFGSHNCFLYSLHFDLSEKIFSERWKSKMASKLTSTPKLIEIDGEKCVASCTTNGLINLNRLEDGVLRCQIQLPGEVFSTPAILDGKVFVGCRNNLLYCLEIK